MEECIQHIKTTAMMKNVWISNVKFVKFLLLLISLEYLND